MVRHGVGDVLIVAQSGPTPAVVILASLPILHVPDLNRRISLVRFGGRRRSQAADRVRDGVGEMQGLDGESEMHGKQ